MDLYTSIDALCSQEQPVSAPSINEEEQPVFVDYEHGGSTTTFWCVIA